MKSKIILVVVLYLNAIVLIVVTGSNVNKPGRALSGSKGKLGINVLKNRHIGSHPSSQYTKKIMQYSREKHNFILRFLNDYDTMEMVPGPHSNINETNAFDCIKASVPQYSEVENPNNSLVCSCKNVKRRVQLQIYKTQFEDFVSPDWSKINASILDSKSENITKLFLVKCSFEIGNEALKVLKLPNLRELYIAESESLLLEPRSLVFSSRDVSVTIYNIDNLTHFPKLHPSVSTLMLDTVKLNDFSTNDFVTEAEWHERSEPGKNINVIIKNSIIDPARAKYNLEILIELKLKSIIFDKIKFRTDPRYPFVKVNVGTYAVFSDLVLEAGNTNIINIVADTLILDKCKIKNWRRSAIRAHVNDANFVSTKLQEPQKHALMHIIPLNKTSKLRLINVTLDDPSKGTLVTKFRHLIYRNIYVERCKCDLVQDLLDIQHDSKSKSTSNKTRSRNRIKRKLSKAILCHPRNSDSNKIKWMQFKKECNNNDKTMIHTQMHPLIIGVLVALLVLVSSIATLVILRWRRKTLEKVNLINKWEIHPPKQLKAVDRTNMSVRYISRPAHVEGEDSMVLSAVETWCEGKRMSYAPDLLRGTTLSHLHPNSHFSVRNTLDFSKEDAERGSVIIHDEIDEYE